MLNELDSIYTELIAEHSRSTENKHHLKLPTVVQKGRNPSCGDEITLELQVEEG
ncbi:MAG: iron-sulfur cluster assembly scaffold protein NifU, partial [Anaerovibrio sp.]|nr:iron-sulfur cluster assembly scaffold protein NifU [Anaerovibrio sp.]